MDLEPLLKQERLLVRQLNRVRKSRAGAEAADKWTAAASLSNNEVKLAADLTELRASIAEASEARQITSDPQELLVLIQRAAGSLPSYMLDDLVDALDALRRVDAPDSWEPAE